MLIIKILNNFNNHTIIFANTEGPSTTESNAQHIQQQKAYTFILATGPTNCSYKVIQNEKVGVQT